MSVKYAADFFLCIDDRLSSAHLCSLCCCLSALSPKVLSSLGHHGSGSSSSSPAGNGFITKEMFEASVPSRTTPGKMPVKTRRDGALQVDVMEVVIVVVMKQTCLSAVNGFVEVVCRVSLSEMNVNECNFTKSDKGVCVPADRGASNSKCDNRQEVCHPDPFLTVRPAHLQHQG